MKLPSGNFYGNTFRRFETPGFALTETSYLSGSRLPKHSHENPYFGFVLFGSYSENFGTNSRTCHPSMLIYHPADEVHHQVFASEVRLFRFELKPSIFAGSNGIGPLRNQSASEFQGGDICKWTAKMYEEFRLMDDVSLIAMDGLALLILSEILRSHISGRKCTSRLLRAKDFIRECYSENLSLSRISQEVEAHPAYLCHQFHLHFGITVGDYIRRVRIEAAREHLVKSKVSLSKIAVLSGFSDQSHFSRNFKKVTGMTPARYRAKFSSS